jgi:hypothetical protein
MSCVSGRRWLIVVLAGVGAGCGAPEDEVWDLAPLTPTADVRIEAVDRDPSLDIRVVNAALAPIQVGCDEPPCPGGEIRVEALQPDGTWVRRQADLEQPRALVVPPGASTVLPTGVLLDLHPGTYRMVVPYRTARGDAAIAWRAVTVTGWAEAAVTEAVAFRSLVTAEECTPVSRDIFETLVGRAEAGPLLELHRSTGDADVRDDLQGELLSRGSFVEYLRMELLMAPLDHVRSAARWMARQEPEVQAPVQRVVAARLVALLDDVSAAVSTTDYDSIEALNEHWPPHAAESLVRRLGQGVDRAEALAALIDVLVYAGRERFEGVVLPRLREVLSARCAGVQAEPVKESCERALALFTAEDPLIGFGRSGTSTWGCRGGRVLSSRCEALRRDWERLEERLGPATVSWR